MNPSKLLLLKENGTFDRRHLHEMERDEKEYLLTVLDKIELLHSRLVPKSAVRYWVLYFSVLALFLIVGFHKNSVNSSQVPPPQPRLRLAPGHQGPPHPNDETRNRHPPHGPRPPPPEHKPRQDPREAPHHGPPHPTQDPPFASLEERIKDFTGGRYAYRPGIDIKHYFRIQVRWYFFFVIESFFVCFPLLLWLTRRKQRRSALRVLEEFIEIENRQLKTIYRCKLSFKGHKALTLTEFSEEKSDEPARNIEQTSIKLYCKVCSSSMKTKNSLSFEHHTIFD